ncbi:MAG: peptidoglycan DD-metalloendopeptidase family protein, partial [Aquificaceae bacterium]
MRLLALLLLFLSGCGIVHIEVRDRTPQKTVSKRMEGKSSSQKTTEPIQKAETQPRGDMPQKREEPPKLAEVLRVQAPVKGRAIRTQRGYFIATSCGEFFRSVGDGRVLYAGDDIKNYSWVVMVDGGDGLVYVYGYAESLLVKRGENVKRG